MFDSSECHIHRFFPVVNSLIHAFRLSKSYSIELVLLWVMHGFSFLMCLLSISSMDVLGKIQDGEAADARGSGGMEDGGLLMTGWKWNNYFTESSGIVDLKDEWVDWEDGGWGLGMRGQCLTGENGIGDRCGVSCGSDEGEGFAVKTEKGRGVRVRRDEGARGSTRFLTGYGKIRRGASELGGGRNVMRMVVLVGAPRKGWWQEEGLHPVIIEAPHKG
ncbi:hypothetical protein Tco_0109070 [Tanacetum coccineum]